MKKLLLLTIAFVSATVPYGQSIGIGTLTPNNSAALEIQNTSKGVLIPRMTTAQRTAIASPATGLLVFDNTTGSFWFKSSGNWVELIDTMNNVWKKNGTNAYLGTGGNVGLGTSAPTYDLHINRSSPSIGLFDAGKNHFSGSVTGDSSHLIINAHRSNVVAGAGDLILQVNGGGQPLPVAAGNVGIGVSNPTQKLSVKGNLVLYTGDDLLGSFTDSDGDLLINAKAGSILSGETPQNIILQLNSGSFATSGKIGIGTNDPTEKVDIAGNLRVTGEINRQGTGTSNMIPIAYGNINADGSIAAGTGNFSAAHPFPGMYTIQVTGESFTSSTAFGIGTVIEESGHSVYSIKAQPGVSIFRFYVKGHSVSFSYDDATGIYYVSNVQPGPVDAPFFFAIYKL